MRGRGRRWLPWVVVAAGVALGAALSAPSTGGGRDLDPASTAPTGSRALVDALRALGTHVDVTTAVPGRGTDAVLVLVDGMGDSRRQALTAWMETGGTLVVADPGSPLNPFRVARPPLFGFVERDLAPHCPVPAVEPVRRVRVPQAVLLRPRPPAVGCFTAGDGAWLVTEQRGRGNLVVLGGAQPLTNALLGDEDNGLFAVSLLAPKPGGHVLVLPLPSPGGGRRTLTDLISPHVTLALVQLGLAFVVLALWRARRLGRPVIEPSGVELPGSELVAAVGRLLQQSRSRPRAAELVREATRRTLAQRLGLGPGAPAEEVADAAASRSGRSVEEVRAVLVGRAPGSDRELVAMAQDVELLSREVTGAS